MITLNRHSIAAILVVVPLLGASSESRHKNIAPTDPDATHLAGAHILISFKGAKRSRSSRSKQEALRLANKIAAKATPGNFAKLAMQYSDDRTTRGGNLGTWKRGAMVAAFRNGVLNLAYGQVSQPVLTPFGYHIILRRHPKAKVGSGQWYAGAHILIAYKGASRALPNITRSKAQARRKIWRLYRRIRRTPAAFAAAARKHSDGPTAKRGGYLGKWQYGRMVKPFDNAVAKLKIGQVSKPVETIFGFHLILRKPLP